MGNLTSQEPTIFCTRPGRIKTTWMRHACSQDSKSLASGCKACLYFEVDEFDVLETDLLDDAGVLPSRISSCVFVLGASNYNLATFEDQRRRLGLSHAHDHRREALHNARGDGVMLREARERCGVGAPLGCILRCELTWQSF